MDIGDGKALLVHQNGQFSALGHKCTHYGAPLAKGYLGDGRVRCPWHGACFNLQTGDIEEFPGLDGIPCFQVYMYISLADVRFSCFFQNGVYMNILYTCTLLFSHTPDCDFEGKCVHNLW